MVLKEIVRYQVLETRFLMFLNQTYETATTSARGKACRREDKYTILSTHIDQKPKSATYKLYVIRNYYVMKYITTQPYEVKYITLSIYKFHFMISQIIPT